MLLSADDFGLARDLIGEALATFLFVVVQKKHAEFIPSNCVNNEVPRTRPARPSQSNKNSCATRISAPP